MQEIEELKRQGLSIRAISRLTGYDRKTISKYLIHPAGVPAYGPRAKRPGKLDRFRPYLQERCRLACGTRGYCCGSCASEVTRAGTRASRQQLFPNVVTDFLAVANIVPQQQLRHGLVAALHAAPAEVLKELFRHSDVHGRVAVLELVMSGLEKDTVDFLANAEVLGFPPSGGAVTPELATHLSPDGVARLGAEAADRDGTLLDHIAAFYANHPRIVARLPARVLVQIMVDLADRSNRRRISARE